MKRILPLFLLTTCAPYVSPCGSINDCEPDERPATEVLVSPRPPERPREDMGVQIIDLARPWHPDPVDAPN
jgi:hypothetical protein